MDLQTKTTTYGVGDYRWLRSSANTGTAVPCTIPVTDLIEARHYPAGVLRSGTLLSKYTSGANSGLFGVTALNATDGRQTPVGVLLEDVPLRKAAGGALVATRIVGAVLLLPLLVDVSFMPPITNDSDDTAHTVVLANLPAHIKAV